MLKKEEKKGLRVYFVGIGGIGISYLAQWFLAHKNEVFGSDLKDSPLLDDLRRAGIKIEIGHRPSNLPKGVDLVIYNRAVPEDNSELVEARKRGIRTKKHSEIIGKITEEYKAICIAGAHGKSSSTAMAALAAMASGMDPTVMVGTKIPHFKSGGKNFKKGKSGWLILEADEYGKSFLDYSPMAAMITNIDREHLDIYKNLTEIKKAFLKFIKNIKSGGVLILNGNDKNLLSLKKQIEKITDKNGIEYYWYSLNDKEAKKIKPVLRVAGLHMLSNAVGVYKLLTALGFKGDDVLAGLAKFKGTWRRFEYKGKFVRKADVVDDYAHHPAEIKATIAAAKESYPKGRVIAVFQPHHQGRLTSLFKDFITCFDEAYSLFVLNTYEVPGREKKVKVKTAKDLADKIPGAEYVSDATSLPYSFKDKIKKGDVILMMGAGDINEVTEKVLKYNLAN